MVKKRDEARNRLLFSFFMTMGICSKLNFIQFCNKMGLRQSFWRVLLEIIVFFLLLWMQRTLVMKFILFGMPRGTVFLLKKHQTLKF